MPKKSKNIYHIDENRIKETLYGHSNWYNNYYNKYNVIDDTKQTEDDYDPDRGEYHQHYDKITNVNINFINIRSLFSYIFPNYFNRLKKDESENLLDTYCLISIMRTFGVMDVKKYEYDIFGSYYNDEVDYTFKNHDKMIEELKKYVSIKDTLSDTKKIKHILKLEYGYILDTIKGINKVEITQISMNDIEKNPNYYEKMSNLPDSLIGTYKELFTNETKDLPFGIFFKVTGGKFRLIDGYHRYSYLFLNGVKNHNAIILSIQ